MSILRRKKYDEETIRRDEKIFANELDRLCRSLDCLDHKAKRRILMIHYPPIPPDRSDNAFSRLIKDYQIDTVIYGHLHNLFPDAPVNFEKDGTQYLCTACDYLDFKPIELVSQHSSL